MQLTVRAWLEPHIDAGHKACSRHDLRVLLTRPTATIQSFPVNASVYAILGEKDNGLTLRD